MASSHRKFDCVVCGSCVVDVLVRPVNLEEAIGSAALVRTEPLEVTTGGMVSNAGITLTRLGMRTAAFTVMGNDFWADVIRSHYQAEQLDTSYLLSHPGAGSSTSVVLIGESGERSFLHAVGAPKLLDKQDFLDNQELFTQSRSMLLGYYSLLPNLQDDLAEVLAAIQRCGCQTALDATGDGGTMEPLQQCLPHLDLYVPSYKEAVHQTGETDPQRILEVYRNAGATGTVGVKLGTEGALLSPRKDTFLEIDPVKPPGLVVDSTGAGDCFFGGLLAGVLRGLSWEESGRLATAAGACCVTALGATTAIRDYSETAALAGIGS